MLNEFIFVDVIVDDDGIVDAVGITAATDDEEYGGTAAYDDNGVDDDYVVAAVSAYTKVRCSDDNVRLKLCKQHL